MKAFSVAGNTFLEAIRNKVIYSVIFFSLVLVAISAFFGSVSLGSQTDVIKDFGLFALSFFGSIITMLSGTALLNKEIKQKTIYNILSKPVSRWQFMLGKYLGLVCTVTLLVFLMGLALVGFVALFEQRIDWLLFQAIAFVVLEVIIVASLVMFFSSLVVTTTLTGLFTLGTFFGGRCISYLAFFLDEGKFNHPLITNTVKFLSWVLPDLRLFNIADQIVSGSAVHPAQCGYAVIYAFAYAGVSLCLGTLIFERRELV